MKARIHEIGTRTVKRSLLQIIAAGIFLGLAACASRPGAAPAAQAAPPTHVEVVNVVQKDVAIYGDWVATLDGFVTPTSSRKSADT